MWIQRKVKLAWIGFEGGNFQYQADSGVKGTKLEVAQSENSFNSADVVQTIITSTSMAKILAKSETVSSYRNKPDNEGFCKDTDSYLDPEEYVKQPTDDVLQCHSDRDFEPLKMFAMSKIFQ
jgi:hypothetical protein